MGIHIGIGVVLTFLVDFAGMMVAQPLVIFCFDFEFLFFFGFVEELVEVLFGHEVGGRGLVEMGGLGFVEFDGVLLEGLVEVDLFEGVHEVGDGLVLLLGLVGVG